jgi:hypothetical protein
MNRNSIKDLKNIFSAKEQLTIGQQLNIRGGDGEDDEDKRREGARSASTSGSTTTTSETTSTAVKPGV